MGIDPLTSAVITGAADAAKKTTGIVLENLISSAASKTKTYLDKTRVVLEAGFSKYIEQTVLRCSKVKTLIHRHEPVSIHDAYVPLNVSNSKRTFSVVDLPSSDETLTKLTITGIAGSGKSMTLKYIYLEACRFNNGFIPIFLELRAVDVAKDSIEEWILGTLEPFTGKFDRDALVFGLQRGSFCLLLDGFDEVRREEREITEREILRFSHDYPKCRVILTSRPDLRLENWPDFVNLAIQPMTVDQVCLLIEKTGFDELITTSFVARVRRSLFQSHRQLLSNPLLATMMLLTFEEYSEIPSKMHVFYRQAFDVLYSKHDRFKPNFRREYTSGLQYDELERHLATFGMFTQLDGYHSFSPDSCNQYARKAIEYEGSSADPSDFVADMVDNLCVLLREGEQLSYIHRSFQEYFCSLFLATRNIPQQKRIIDKIVKSSLFDRILPMAFEINPESIERAYCLEKLRTMQAEFKKLGSNYRKILGSLVSEVAYTNHGEEDGEFELSFGYSSGKNRALEPKWASLGIFLGSAYPLLNMHRLHSAKEVEANLSNESHFDGGYHGVDLKSVSLKDFNSLGLNKLTREYIGNVDKVITEISRRLSSRKIMLSDILI